MGKVIASRTKALTDVPFHYFPGCAHGIVHRLVAEAIEELGLIEKNHRGCPCRLLRIRIQLF
ncbi:MAG: Thiamine pyrophosphate protein domain protein TPP-binding [Clostridia bacterium 41_269]|nr:MAG: Thiamine pyrophosphate protein domain protein TPP-binding [Clostridia bacterium 41_269]